MKKFIFIIFSFTLIFLFLYQDAALANVDRSDFNPEEDGITISGQFSGTSSERWSVSALDNNYDTNQGQGITIAILDSGVTKIPELSCVDFVHEYDSFWGVSGPGSARDNWGHGTMVALTIADCSYGIANAVDIMPVRISTTDLAYLGEPFDPYYFDGYAVANGIIWAVDHGADIINMSFQMFTCYKTWQQGCREETGPYAGWIDNAIEYATSKEVLIIASSGNGYNSWVSYPANHPSVWAVGSVDEDLLISQFSNTEVI